MNLRNQEPDGSEDLIPTRSSLLGRLKNWQDNESWRAFFDTYWKLIYGFAVQRGLTHQEAEEVVQETVVAVAKSIGSFQYDPARCAFKTWLLTVTRSKIANQFERRARRPGRVGPPPDDSRPTPLLERLPDERAQGQWDRTWDEDWHKNLMDVAIQRVKRRVPIEQYQMFDLFVLKQWPAADVARTLGVTIGHVYVAKHRIAKLVRKEVQALEAKECDAMKFEFQTRWLRVLIELWPALAEIRRYRAVPSSLEGATSRLLRRQIAGRLQHLQAKGST